MQYLYLIRCNEHYKIGVTNDMDSRLAALQTGNPYLLTLESCYGFPNAEIVEKVLHQKFSPNKTRGEWFLLTGKLVNEFKSLCSVLGGYQQPNQSLPTENEVKKAEELQELALGGNEGARWDYAQMFKDGWRIEVRNRQRGRAYWTWRMRRGSIDKIMYGGRVQDLPLTVAEMRKKYG